MHKLGGFKVQGRGQVQAERMLEDAVALEQVALISCCWSVCPMNLDRPCAMRCMCLSSALGRTRR
ncbi:MAG: hypothetical protein R3F24_03330 [Gammaproteobacteria bacterium]